MFGNKKKDMEETIKQQEQEIQLLRSRANELTEKLVRFQGKEEAIISALTSAQDSASKTMSDAVLKRDEIISAAHKESCEIKIEAENMLNNAKRECAELLSRTGEENERLLANARLEAERINNNALAEADARIKAANAMAKTVGDDAERLKTDFTSMLQLNSSAYRDVAKELKDKLNAIANEAAAQADQLRLCCEKNNALEESLERLNVCSDSDFDMLVKYNNEYGLTKAENKESEPVEQMDLGSSENEEGELTDSSEPCQDNSFFVNDKEAAVIEKTATVIDNSVAGAIPLADEDIEKVWTVSEVEKTVPAEVKLRADADLSTLLNEVLRS